MYTTHTHTHTHTRTHIELTVGSGWQEGKDAFNHNNYTKFSWVLPCEFLGSHVFPNAGGFAFLREDGSADFFAVKNSEKCHLQGPYTVHLLGR